MDEDRKPSCDVEEAGLERTSRSLREDHQQQHLIVNRIFHLLIASHKLVTFPDRLLLEVHLAFAVPDPCFDGPHHPMRRQERSERVVDAKTIEAKESDRTPDVGTGPVGPVSGELCLVPALARHSKREATLELGRKSFNEVHEIQILLSVLRWNVLCEESELGAGVNLGVEQVEDAVEVRRLELEVEVLLAG